MAVFQHLLGAVELVKRTTPPIVREFSTTCFCHLHPNLLFSLWNRFPKSFNFFSLPLAPGRLPLSDVKCYDRWAEGVPKHGFATLPPQCAKFRIMESAVQHEEVSDNDIYCLAQSLSSKEDCKLVADHLTSVPEVSQDLERESRLEVAAVDMLMKSKKYTFRPKKFTYRYVYEALVGAIKQSGSRDLECALIEFELCVGHTHEREKCKQ